MTCSRVTWRQQAPCRGAAERQTLARRQMQRCRPAADLPLLPAGRNIHHPASFTNLPLFPTRPNFTNLLLVPTTFTNPHLSPARPCATNLPPHLSPLRPCFTRLPTHPVQPITPPLPPNYPTSHPAVFDTRHPTPNPQISRVPAVGRTLPPIHPMHCRPSLPSALSTGSTLDSFHCTHNCMACIEFHHVNK